MGKAGLMKFKLLLLLITVVLAAASTAAGESYGIKDCIRAGIENNLGIKKAEYELGKMRSATKGIKSQYEPFLNMQLRRNHSESLRVEVFPGAYFGGATEQDTLSLGLGKKLGLGGVLNLSLSRMRDEGESIMKAYNPLYQSSLALSYNQPLWRNSLGVNDRKAMAVFDSRCGIAELALQAEKNALKNNITKAYWNLIFAGKNLEIQIDMLERTKNLLEDNREKLRDGLIEEVDIIAAEASVALGDVSIIRARDALEAAEEDLKRIMNLPGSEPVEFFYEFTGELKHEELDGEETIERALANSPELKILNINTGISSIQSRIKKNEKRANVNLVAQYGLNGMGDSWQSDFDSITAGDYRTWYVGLQMDYKPFKRGALSALRQAEYDGLISVASEEDIRAGITVRCRNLARAINTAAEYYEAAVKAVRLQQRKLKLEERKFSQGRSSNRFVLAYQDDLRRAEIEYYRSITGYESLLADLRFITGENK